MVQSGEQTKELPGNMLESSNEDNFHTTLATSPDEFARCEPGTESALETPATIYLPTKQEATSVHSVRYTHLFCSMWLVNINIEATQQQVMNPNGDLVHMCRIKTSIALSGQADQLRPEPSVRQLGTPCEKPFKFFEQKKHWSA
eukprot:3878990-Amphidinium_carterae.1